MGERCEPLKEVTTLGEAARRYAACLFAAAPECFPGALAPARAFFKLIGQAENPDDPDDIPGRSMWVWTRFLVGWPTWQPHHLERRLFLPSAESLSHLIGQCRDASVEPVEPVAQTRRWNPFTWPKPIATPTELRELLSRSAKLLEFIATAHAPVLERAAQLGRAVDQSIANLPTHWIPARLARAAATCNTWPLEPPQEAPAFLTWLAHILNFALDRPQCAQAPELFASVLREAFDHLAAEGHLASEVIEHLSRFQSTADAAKWFTLLAVLTAHLGHSESPWPRLLARLACHALYQLAPSFEPPLDRRTLEVPRDWFRPGRADVRYVVDESAAGSVVCVDRFAIPPQRAAVRVSLGPVHGSAFAVAAAWDALAGAGLDLDRFRDLLEPALEAVARRGQAIPEDLLARVVAQLSELSENSGTIDPVWDVFLKRVREWAHAMDCTVLPEEWTFAAGGSSTEPVHGVHAKVVFRRDVPPGRIARVKAFGLTGPNGVELTSEIVVSAGEPPPGLTDLEAAAEQIEGEAGEELRAAFRALRPAGAGGYLELAAIDLFTRFWDHVHSLWSTSDAPTAEKFAAGLNAMLCETFHLEVIQPANYRDYPAGWVFVPPGTRMSTGRVLHVLRPGLAAAGELRVPARVEAE